MYQMSLSEKWRRSAPACVLVAAAALGLAGCAPSPFHLDPLSVNGRDGGGDVPSYAALMRIGAAARQAGDYANALSVYRRAASIATRNPAPFVEIGDTLLAMGSVNEAIVAYQSALARDSGLVAAQKGLAKGYLRTGRPELALVPLNKALKHHPGDPKLLLLLGVTKDLLGQHRAAQDVYRQALKHAPRDPGLSVDLALSLALSGDYQAAIGVLQPIALAPAASAAERQTLALIYGLDGNRQEAARLGRIDLDEATVQHNLAYIETLRKLSPEARSRAILSSGSALAGEHKAS